MITFNPCIVFVDGRVIRFTVSRQLLNSPSSTEHNYVERDGRYDIFGAYLLACGVSWLLLNHRAPLEIMKLPEQCQWLLDGGALSDAAEQLFDHSESTLLTADEREQKLEAVFWEQGIDLRFGNLARHIEAAQGEGE